VADDYNFNIDHFNKAMYLGTAIESTSLPVLFKTSLKKAYATELITKGIEKNLNKEKKLISSMPVQGTLVMIGAEKNSDASVKVFRSSSLDEIMSEVYKDSLNDQSSAAVKSYLAGINPFISETIINSQIRGEERKITQLYKITENEILWFPDRSKMPKISAIKEKKSKIKNAE
jgi:hypothetical protein